MKIILTILFGCVLNLYACPDLFAIQEKKDRDDVLLMVDNALDACRNHALDMYESVKDKKGRLPRYNHGDTLVTSTNRWWTSGYFPGTLWYLYSDSKDPELKAAAMKMTDRVLDQQYTTRHHDVGVMLNNSAGNAFRLGGEEKYKAAVINAAKSLSTRFNEKIGCIKSWDHKKQWSYPVIIDNMLNLEILMEATRLSGDESYRQIAVSHADRTLVEHFRKDASCYHVVSYSPETGNPEFKGTNQGLSDDSSWARGQAWALYGYTMMYRYTGNKAYLKHAVKVAHFIFSHPNMPSDLIPYWDFDAPDHNNGEEVLRDASSACAIASGLLELSRYVPKRQARNYVNLATRQLKVLSSDEYMAKGAEAANFILKHSVGSMPTSSEVDVSLTYADYYYVEALLRLKSILEKEN